MNDLDEWLGNIHFFFQKSIDQMVYIGGEIDLSDFGLNCVEVKL